jgi:phosphinothricin acetyltransferase
VDATEPGSDGVAVRDAARADLPAVAAIYTHYVLKTTTTFNTQVRTPAEWTDRFETHVERGPYHLLVAERAGRVEGYVETQPFRPKPAYDPSVELSIYVAPDTTAAGVGRALFDALLARLATGDFHRLYSVIALPNDRSVRFHERDEGLGPARELVHARAVGALGVAGVGLGHGCSGSWSAGSAGRASAACPSSRASS